MIVIVKLFYSAATACFAVGFAARRRANLQHRRLMAMGVAVAWAGTAVLLVGRLWLDLPLRPAYWLLDLTGGGRALGVVLAVQQSLGILSLLVLSAQVVLGGLRHPLHRPAAAVALPLWLLLWVTAMFGYV